MTIKKRVEMVIDNILAILWNKTRLLEIKRQCGFLKGTASPSNAALAHLCYMEIYFLKIHTVSKYILNMHCIFFFVHANIESIKDNISTVHVMLFGIIVMDIQYILTHTKQSKKSL